MVVCVPSLPSYIINVPIHAHETESPRAASLGSEEVVISSLYPKQHAIQSFPLGYVWTWTLYLLIGVAIALQVKEPSWLVQLVRVLRGVSLPPFLRA